MRTTARSMSRTTMLTMFVGGSKIGIASRLIRVKDTSRATVVSVITVVPRLPANLVALFPRSTEVAASRDGCKFFVFVIRLCLGRDLDSPCRPPFIVQEASRFQTVLVKVN